MLRNFKRILSCLIIIIIVAFCINHIGTVCSPVYSGDAFNSIDTFHSLPENSVELIAYGSSHLWKGLDVTEMYKKYGIAAYNYGCNWQHLNTTLLFIKDSLKTQSPKVALVETFNVNGILENTDLNGEIYYTRAIENSKAKSEYLKQCFGDDYTRYLSYYVPFVAFHSNWNNLIQWNFMNPTDGFDFLKTMGSFSSDGVMKIELPDYKKFEQWSISVKPRAVLDEIVKICKENDIELVLYTAPFGREYTLSDALKEYAKENDCVYLNLFEYTDEMKIDPSKDFVDVGHLNSSGAKKVAAFLGKYISSKYDVTDMREKPDNFWEKNIK